MPLQTVLGVLLGGDPMQSALRVGAAAGVVVLRTLLQVRRRGMLPALRCYIYGVISMGPCIALPGTSMAISQSLLLHCLGPPALWSY